MTGEVEVVAWQWRSRMKGGAWDAWERGRYRGEVPPFADVEERALVPASALEALRADNERLVKERADALLSLAAACMARDAFEAAILGYQEDAEASLAGRDAEIAKAVSEEREACAKVVHDTMEAWGDYGWECQTEGLLEAIRARGVQS